ncbi:MAG TPA: hypothetical protein VKA46_33540 [Gemmataceae bacterium]|nr:hypothetical protein [Gemmataceae bacterium]
MIELTHEQQQALEKHNGEPVRVFDPLSRAVYILVRSEDYETLTGVPLAPLGDGFSGVSPQMLRSQQAFWRDLPELLKSRRNCDKWVAYHGDERIGMAKTKTDLYHLCVGRGLPPGDFYMGKIEEDKVPPWVLPSLKESPFEFTDELVPPSTDP